MIFRVGGFPWEDEGLAAALALLAHAHAFTYPRYTFVYFGGGGTNAAIMKVRTFVLPFQQRGHQPSGAALAGGGGGSGQLRRT